MLRFHQENLDNAFKDLISHKMLMNLTVFGAFVKNKIRGDMPRSLTIIEKVCRMVTTNTKVITQMMYPTNFGSSIC